MKKKTKIPALSSEQKEALALLYARPEFKAFLGLVKIEENNIIIRSFKIPASSEDLAIRKSHLEGRIYELRKLIRTFESCKNKEE